MKSSKPVIGIDEVGRGALAGPVTVAALALSRNLKSKLPLRDSKKLSPKQREAWFDFIKKHKIPYAIASVSPKIIDKINISQAANLAASRAIIKLITKLPNYSITKCEIYLDGGLYLLKILHSKFYFLNSRTIIRGDEKIPAISLASIVAKVSRDRMMKKYHKKYPHYDFVHNVGYGVKKHAKSLKKYGPSFVHRRSFKIPLA